MPFWHTNRGAGVSTPYAAGEEPLRAELLNAEQMEERGREIAAQHKTRTARVAANPLLQRLAQNADVIRECCKVLADAIKDNQKVTPAGEWLLDNLYLIDEQIRTARRHLPKRYSWQLPVLAKGPSVGLPRVYDIALKAISHGDGRFDEDSLRRFVAAYQEISELTLGELWAIPIVLRLALIENLRRVAFSVRADRMDRNVAIRWADEMIDVVRRDPTRLILIAADMAREQPPMSSSFVSELSRRLQPLGDAVSLPMTWIDLRLAESGLTSGQLVQSAQREQAADQVSVSNCISSLRLLDALDWKTFVESVSVVERILREDPTHTYPHMSFATRDTYRHVVEKLAREADLDEPAVASATLELALDGADRPHAELARHVGYFLVGDGQPILRERCHLRRRASFFWKDRPQQASFSSYFVAIVGLGILLMLPVLTRLPDLPVALWVKFATALCAVIALSQLAVALVNRGSALLIAPQRLPQMDFRDGVPDDAKTLVAIPSLLSSVGHAQRLLDDLEIRYLANRDRNLRFALLTDFVDAPEAALDSDAAILEAAVVGIETLNARYDDNRFFLLHRPRRWNERDHTWMGFERKRGKLADLNALLRGDAADRFSRMVGDVSLLGDVRYVITLDSDSQLPRDVARKLIATMAHPLNRPRMDAARRIVDGGYGILQPRIGSVLPTDGTTPYANLFGGDPGIDPYTRAVSDTYQDLFGEGSFIGKGIYDVDAFEHVLANRFPDNRILSHDLLEGCYARSGLATDIELYEEYPRTYLADARRRHRWMRGDWQIAAWLFPRVLIANGQRERNVLSSLSLWKIFDNLRRSVVPIALVGLLLIAWLCMPSPTFWVALVVEILLLPAIVDLALSLASPKEEGTTLQSFKVWSGDAMRRVAQVLITAVCLPFEAWLSFDAIARTYWRVHVSRRRLLQWMPSSAVHRGERNPFGRAVSALWIAPVLAVSLAVLLFERTHLWHALPWLVAWFFSPVLVWLLGVAPAKRSERLQPAQIAFLRNVARRTWNFFECFVGPEDHWLPPDNYQEHPIAKTAHRTSPTNIGLYLLSTLAAHDFGYLSLRQLIGRLSQSFDTLERLPRHRGHFYNWYDTRTAQPLAPLYVSTVDSGNLIAHLLTLRQGLLERRSGAVINPAVLAGVRDALTLARDRDPSREDELWKPIAQSLDAAESNPPRTPHDLLSLLSPMNALLGASEPTSATIDPAQDPVVLLRRQITAAIDDIDYFFGNLDASPAFDSTATLTHIRSATADDVVAIRADETRRALESLAVRCGELARVDFDFLFDANRSLFTIGYNVSEHRRDAGFYDLLASEARLGIFVAIARGSVVQDAWFSLGRLLTSAMGRQVLLSWSGSMFEYLMPQLVMPSFPGTLLDETCRSAVAQQIDYARSKNVPWGISESGYNVTDAAQNYQYRAFGVPGLGLQRGLAQELVIAPYASALALTISPREAERNLRTIAANGWLAPWGFYEAIDYTPARVPHGRNNAIVRSFMAHHHGMTLLAIAHAVLGQPMQRRFGADRGIAGDDVAAPGTHAALVDQLEQRSGDGRRAFDAGCAADRDARFRPRRHQPSGGATADQRPLSPDGDERRRRLQPLARHRDHALARGRDARRLGRVLLSARRRDRQSLVEYAASDPDRGRLFRSGVHGIVGGISPTPRRYRSAYADRRLARGRHRTPSHPHHESRACRTFARCHELRRSRAGFGDRRFAASRVRQPVRSDRSAGRSRRDPRYAPAALERRSATLDDASAGAARCRILANIVRIGSPAFRRTRQRPGESHRRPFDGARCRERRVRCSIRCSRSAIASCCNRISPAVIDLVLGVAENRDQCVALVEKYRDRHLADRAIEIAWTHNRIALGQINISEVDAQAYARLAGAILYADPARRAPASTIASNHLAQPGLWAHAISGDLPIVLLKMSGPENLNLARQLVNAHVYCRMKGLDFDLVIWNEERGGYRQALHDEIMAIVGTSPDSAVLEQPGGVFVRSIEQINHEDRVLMQSVARVVLHDQGGSLTEQLGIEKTIGSDIVVPELVASRAIEPATPVSHQFPVPPLTLANGIGGFAAEGAEYVISIDETQKTPLPWVNVIANPHFGCVVSESGSGYTWQENAHEYRLTPWSNDPVSDPSGEAIYVRDEESGHFWSATPAPAPGRGRYVVRHGFGYSVFEHAEAGITSHLRLHVDVEAPVKFFMLRLQNDSGRTRRLSVTGYVEWVLGDLREKTAMHVVTELDDTGALMARNAYSIEFHERVAFFDVDNPQRTLSGDRTEFIGRNCSLRRPAAMLRQSLSGRLGAAMDPCGAIQIPVELADGESRDFIFRLGVGHDRQDATKRVERFRRNGAARASFDAVQQRWKQLLGCGQRALAGSDVRCARQWLAVVPGDQLPVVGAQRVLPVRRCVRVPRSVAGRDVARACRCLAVARTDRAERVAPVRRRRRAALVASAGGTRRAHAVFGRFLVAPAGDRALRRRDR